MSYIPRPPRISMKTGKQVSYTDVDWTAEQTNFTLRMVIDKIINMGQDGVSISQDTYAGDQFNIKIGSKVYVTIDSKHVFMILDDAAGGFWPRWLFWQDREVKATMKELHSALKNRSVQLLRAREEEKYRYKKETAMKALFNAFPEAIAQEFEKHILESKDGKSEES